MPESYSFNCPDGEYQSNDVCCKTCPSGEFFNETQCHSIDMGELWGTPVAIQDEEGVDQGAQLSHCLLFQTLGDAS
jgi:hypothetical protein